MATKKTAAAKLDAELEGAALDMKGNSDPTAQKLESVDAHLATLDKRINSVVEVLKGLRLDVDEVRGRLNV